MSEDQDQQEHEPEPQMSRPARRHSLERYRPGARNHRGDDENGGDDFSDSSFREDASRGRGRGRMKEKAPLAPNDLRRKINEARKNHPPAHSVEYINQQNINIHSNYHRNNNHHRNDHRYYYSKQNKSNNGNPKKGDRPQSKKNTECFDPSYEPPDMRILMAQPQGEKYERKYSTRDVIQVSHLFNSPEDANIYDRLLKEIEETGVNPDELWQLWHGDSHLIADDKQPWKEKCPTFSMVIDKIADYFSMDVKATRFNWYRDATEWKPYHHDAAAVKPKIAKTQNFTAAVSFGSERDAAFQHAKTKTVVSMPQPNGTVYTFGRDVNVMWRHGIPQVSPDDKSEGGRISIILWGWIEQYEL